MSGILDQKAPLPADYSDEKVHPVVEKEFSIGRGSNLEEKEYRAEKWHLDERENDGVHRKLHQRHVQMIAIAGTIGTGLFLGSGKALARAGPLGALLAYAHVGTVAFSSLCAVSEMTSMMPISGSFPHFAARFADPALGFAVGWNYFYNLWIGVPVEVTAAQILLAFWDSNKSRIPLYTALLAVLTTFINVMGVRWFGESEFGFAIIKLSLITGLIICGLVIDLGGGPDGDRRGFRYWQNPGAMNTYLEHSNVSLGRLLALVGTIVQAGFSYGGMELVAIAASETKSPRRNIAKAVRRVFWRIVIFYILGVLVTGMLIPHNDERLLRDTGDASESPYVIAIQIAGIKGLPHIINAGVFTSAFSAGNSFLYSGSRVLYGLALRGQAPRIFIRCTKKGLPWVAVATVSLFSLLSFLNIADSSAAAFNWLVSLSAVGSFFSWMSINLTYLAFYRGMKAQGINRKQLAYFSSLQPWLSIWGVFWTIVFILTSGFSVFWEFKVADFLTSYINIPLFIVLYFGYKLIKKTKIWKPSEIDFVTGVPTLDETEEPEKPPKNIWDKIGRVLF